MKKNISFYTLLFISSLVFMKLSGLLSKLILARTITPYEYGIITLLVISLPGLLQLFTNFCIFEIISHPKEGKKYLGFSIIYGLLSSFLVLVFLYFFHEEIFNFLNLPLDSWFFYWVILSIVIVPVTLVGNFIGLFRGLRDYSTASILSLAPPILRLLLILLAVYVLSIFDFNKILFIFAIPALIVLVLIFAYKFWPIVNLLRKSTTVPSKKILLFGFSIYLVGIFSSLMQHLNKIIISHDLGILWQGYYDVSLSVVSLVSFFSVAMYFISIPEATSKENKKDFFKKGEFGDVVKVLFSLVIFSTLLLCFYPSFIIEFLFSSDYLKAADYIAILAVGYIFLFIQQFLAYMHISFNKNSRDLKSLMYITLIFIILSPIFTHLFIEFFGFLGAYVSTTLFLFLYTLVTIFFTKDLFSLKFLFNKIEGLILAILTTSFFLVYIKPSFMFGFIISAGIYFTLIFMLGYINKELISSILSLKQKHV